MSPPQLSKYTSTPPGHVSFSARAQVLALVVDRLVEAVLAHQVVSLVRPAGDAHGSAAGDLRDLADDMADGSPRARDDDRVAGLRAADVEQAEVGGEAGGADCMERERGRVEERRHGAQHPAACDGVVLPPELPDDQVAFGEAAVVRLDDLAERLGGHHLPDLDVLRIRAGRAHASALVRVDRGPQHADEHLARAWLGDRLLDEGEVALGGEAGWARGQRDRAARAYLNRHVPPPSNSLRMRRLTTMRCTSSGPS